MTHKQSTELTNFLEKTKAHGISDEFLTHLLIHHGWPKDEVFAALGAYWERVTDTAVPQRAGSNESSRDAFLYLLSFATLAIWASALGSLLYRFIDYWFPDAIVLGRPSSLRSLVSWQMASIAVAFPIFLLVMRTILVESQHQPERLQSGVRKWLTYIALLLTAGGLITDLIYFLDYFLTGELTTRFLLKSLSVLVICAGIFVFYLGSLRWDKQSTFSSARKQSLLFGIGSTVIVVTALCVGLGLAGTPSTQRHLQADKRRVQNLRAIATSMYVRFTRVKREGSGNPLPLSLADLARFGLDSTQTKDPETGNAYDYRRLTSTNYKLCAVFSAPAENDSVPVEQFWYHGKGQTCFTLDASVQPNW